MSRKRFTERQVLETLDRQGVMLTCFRCGDRLNPMEAEREHVVELALGGKDDPTNCVYSCKPCHAIVTNGIPATTAGSSKNRLAKANNENRRTKFVVQKLPVDQERPQKVRFGFARKREAAR